VTAGDAELGHELEAFFPAALTPMVSGCTRSTHSGLEVTIAGIKDTGSAMGNTTTRVLEVSFPTPSGTVRATSTLTPNGLMRAKFLREDQLSAGVLVHPGNPARVIFLGNLPEVGPDFD
jgi:hypothetical protein